MKNTYIKYFILVILLISNSSCEKLIEVDEPSDQLGTNQVFDNTQTAYAALGGLYASLRDQSVLSGNAYGIGSLLGSYADDLDCYYNDQNAYSDIGLNQQRATNSVILRLWNTSYKQIYTANSIIAAIENSSNIEQSDANQIKGEALAIRSVIYFYLQQIFGDIPYTTSLDYELNRNLVRTNSNSLLNQLIEDLKMASDLLSDTYRNSERIYLNRYAAKLMASRIYLLTGDFTQAENMAKDVLASGQYLFKQNLNEVFQNTGKHIIWQFSPSRTSDGAHEVIHYFFQDAPPHAYAITENLLNSFSAEDLRKSNWIKNINYGNQIWYRPYKYKNLPGASTNEFSIVFRLEEIYFIMAEALAKQNRISDALPYINYTRQRAGLSALSNLTQDDFSKEFLSEKRREFFAEFGHRFLDLKRFDKLKSLSALKPNWSNHHEFWPLPLNEMLLNPNLKPQNNGY